MTQQETPEDTPQILEKLRKDKESHTYPVCGQDFLVFPNVFSPKYFGDTEFYADKVPFVAGSIKDKKILEIGPGIGALAVILAQKGAKVTAVDINQDAVLNTQANADKFNMTEKIAVLAGDIYKPLSKQDKFDIIFWNLPFGFIEEKELDPLEKSTFDPLYKSSDVFFKQAEDYLLAGGRLLYGFSTSYGNSKELEKILGLYGYKSKLLIAEDFKSDLGNFIRYELFEAEKTL